MTTTPAATIADALTEARVYLEDAARQLRAARPAAAGIGADHTVTAVDGFLTDLNALADRMWLLEADWQHRTDPTRAA